MPRKASGRQRGRPPYSWNWAAPLRNDPDWWLLQLLLMRIEKLGQDDWHPRSLIREILATLLSTYPDLANPVFCDPIFSTDPPTVNRIETKFGSLVDNAVAWLRYKHLPITNEATIKEARDILKNCFIWQGITAEEHRIIEEAHKIWQRVHEREEFYKRNYSVS